MKIVRFETLIANAGLRNYLFVRLHTDTGLTGIGEASLEWQEKTVQTFLQEWVEGRVLGCDPFNVERVVGDLIRDQYQGGATAMTAISAVEVAMMDIVGKVCGQPLYNLLGGRYHAVIQSYANGWYGKAREPHEFAERAKETVARGYHTLKFDPFGVAWKELSPLELDEVIEIVAAVRESVGGGVRLIIEYHGRLSANAAITAINALKRFNPWWSEEPVPPENIELLAVVKQETGAMISSGERLYTVADFQRLFQLRAVDVAQFDVSHCGGILLSKKLAAMAAAHDIFIAPHCSIGPVALAAALHVAVSTPNFLIQETFAEFDVPWRDALVKGWSPIKNGQFTLGDVPGLGLELDDVAIAEHPYIQNPFPSLWDADWIANFKQDIPP